METHITDRPQSLREWRTAQGLTQDKAAKLLGIDQGRYSILERGRPCFGKQAKTICEVTKVPLEILVGAV